MPGEERPGQRADRRRAGSASSGRRTGRSAPAARARRLDDSATIDNVVVQIDVEGFADVGEQYAERRPVEFVDGVQSEQDEQRECGLAAADRRAASPSGGPSRSWNRRHIDGSSIGAERCPSGCAVVAGVTLRSVPTMTLVVSPRSVEGSAPFEDAPPFRLATSDAGRRNRSGRRRYGRGPSRRRTRAVRRCADSRPTM